MVDDKETSAAAEPNTVDNGTSPSPAPAPSDADAAGSGAKKKRGVDASWRTSKDEASDEEGSDGEGEGTGTGRGEFQRADAETLSKRRIVKARRPFRGEEEGASTGTGAAAAAATAPNPFANVSLTAEAPAAAAPAPAQPSGGGSVFGSKFGHVNAASILAGRAPTGFGGGGGFGAAATAPAASTAEGGGEPAQEEGSITRPGTGPGLGSVPFGFASYKLNPFAAAASTTAGSDGGGFASSPSKRKPPSELVKGMMGDEEGGRGAAGAGGEEEGGDEDVEAEPANATYLVPKVVPGLKDASYKPVTGEEEETCVLQLRSKLYRLTEVASDGAAAGASSSGGGGGGGGPRRDWVECGVGQAKILVPHPQPLEVGQVPAAARVVMRREPGTSVLINARIKPPLVTAAKHADKALRFTCLDEKGQPSTFLFRFKLQDESEQFLAELERQLKMASSSDAMAASAEEGAAEAAE